LRGASTEPESADDALIELARRLAPPHSSPYPQAVSEHGRTDTELTTQPLETAKLPPSNGETSGEPSKTAFVDVEAKQAFEFEDPADEITDYYQRATLFPQSEAQRGAPIRLMKAVLAFPDRPPASFRHACATRRSAASTLEFPGLGPVFSRDTNLRSRSLATSRPERQKIAGMTRQSRTGAPVARDEKLSRKLIPMTDGRGKAA
jgi:hypothetical protein